ncbi:MAG: NADH-quinone oxidoreductase subunit J [Hyphomicrobiales bacterium]
MAISAIFFYLFSALAVGSGVMVVAARNPVHSVLFLILTFFNAAGLFILLGAEFLAMILLMVYVGAVAVLFLFVVMMLDIDFVVLRRGLLQYFPIGATIGLVMLVELITVVGSWTIAGGDTVKLARLAQPASAGITNTQALGRLLYTHYAYAFQSAGIILLIAMIGAIVLTLRHKQGVKRQTIARQVARTPQSAIEVRKVGSGQGL